jgi:hypothetical protein
VSRYHCVSMAGCRARLASMLHCHG